MRKTSPRPWITTTLIMSIGILWDLLYSILWFASSIENYIDRRLIKPKKKKKEYSITVLSLQTNTTNAQNNDNL